MAESSLMKGGTSRRTRCGVGALGAGVISGDADFGLSFGARRAPRLSDCKPGELCYGEAVPGIFYMKARRLGQFSAAICCGILLGLSGGAGNVQADSFTLDSNRSSITISGSVFGGTFAPQVAGSLTTTFGGTLQATTAGNTIQFTGQSQILAQTNGSWQPKSDGTAGSEPADAGAKASLGIASGVAALREVLLDAISPPIPMTGGQFGSTNLIFLFPSNAPSSLAYNVTGLLSQHGTLPLTGYGTNRIAAVGTLAAEGNQQVLTIPVDATFYLTLAAPNDTVIRVQGQLVGVEGGQAPQPLIVQGVSVQNQTVQVQWQGTPGQQFQIQSSTNLQVWQNNGIVVTPASGVNTWTGALTGLLNFYRLAK